MCLKLLKGRFVTTVDLKQRLHRIRVINTVLCMDRGRTLNCNFEITFTTMGSLLF